MDSHRQFYSALLLTALLTALLTVAGALVSSASTSAFDSECIKNPSAENPSSESDEQNKLDGAIAKQVASLLSQLKSVSETESQEAEKKLIGIGPAILAYLPRLPSSVTGEFRDRLDHIRDSLQSKAIGEYAEPSTVTLQGKMPAGDVLLEMMEQTDNQITIQEIPNKQMDVHFERTPFWEALDSILDELHLEATTSSKDASLKLVPSQLSGARSVRGAYAGVFRIEPTRVESARTMKVNPLGHLRVEIELMWEPRLRPVYFHFPMQSLFVECDNGEILSAISPDSSPEYTPTDTHSLEAALWIELPTRSAKNIRRLTGTLLAAIPGAMVQLEFDELEKVGPKTQKVGKLKVVMEEMKKREEIYEFKLLISLQDAGQSMDSFRGWLMTHAAYIVNADGKRIENAGWQTYQMNSEAVGLSYFFDVGPSIEGCRLIYSAPGAVAEQRVDYLLKDIPLP